jgi:hypothetical protein
VVDLTGLDGALSSTIDWGDGSTSSGSISGDNAAGDLKIRFDYRYDSGSFFNSSRRAALQNAADVLTARFSDELAAIIPGGNKRWTAQFFNPATGSISSIENLRVNKNEMVVFAGVRDLPGNQLGEGGPGGFSISGSTPQAWRNTVRARGQTGALSARATDFGPWGGSLAFDNRVDWYFGKDPDGQGSSQQDFATVATHELMHLFGFGIEDGAEGRDSAWEGKVSGSSFTGSAARAAHEGSGNVPLDSSAFHFRSDVVDEGQAALMTASLQAGTRKLLTRLDIAVLDDIGWELIDPTATLAATHKYGDNGSYPISITITGNDFGLKTYTAAANITNVAPTLVARDDVSIQVGLNLNITNLGVFSDPGFRVLTATPPTNETFTYSIDWGDGSAVDTGTATVDRVGNPARTTLGSFNGQHRFDATGTYTVTYEVTDDDGGSDTESFTVTVSPPPEIRLSLSQDTIAENAGESAAKLTVEVIGFASSSDLTIQLTSSDTTEVQLPASVTMPAGLSTIDVDVAAIDDRLLDQTQTVELIASIGSVTSEPATLDVEDFETLELVLSRASVREDAGDSAAILTITRSNTNRSGAVNVRLTSNDPSEARLPDSITIPAGVASVDAVIAAIDDSLIDGLQTARLTAENDAYESAAIDLAIQDFEPLSLQFDRQTISEESSNNTLIGTIQLPFDAPAGGFVVSLGASPNDQVGVPESVRVPAGQSSGTFQAIARDDFLVEGDHIVRLSIQRSGMVSSARNLAIIDNDTALFQNPDNPLDVDGQNGVNPRDALLVINSLNKRGSRELNPANEVSGIFYDVSGDGRIAPIDALMIINAINKGTA